MTRRIMTPGASRLFESFFLGGFECTTGYNRYGQWIDQVAATRHDEHADDDYRLLRQAGLRAAREGIRWPIVDLRGRYDFSSIRPFLAASRRHEIEVIWDLFHFGYPADVDIFDDSLAERFADYCYAAARRIAAATEGTCYFTPLNEPSYFAWAAGEVGLFAPHARGRGWELKARLVRAAIAGIDAIRSACRSARIVNVDPICRVAPPLERPDLAVEAERFNRDVVFQSWDILAGRLLPELGGSLEHLDIVGINYYWTNQWELWHPERPLHPGDPRYQPISVLIRTVAERYGREVLVTETSERSSERAAWIRALRDQCGALLESGVPLRGVCLYPILGMPEWHEPQTWAAMGLWDLAADSPQLARTCCAPMLEALREAEPRLAALAPPRRMAWAAVSR